ncbi:MAG: hypothetical protein ABJN24_00245 [Hyphomicrobiales bacterium]
MFKKILIAAGTALSVIAASISFQSSANAANAKFGVHTVKHKGTGFHGAKRKGFNQNRLKRKGFAQGGVKKKSFSHKNEKKSFAHKKVKKKSVVHKSTKHKKAHIGKKVHKKAYVSKKNHVHKPIYIKKHHALSNKKLRRHLRAQGLYNIHFIKRGHSVVKLIADNRRGYLGEYKVNAYNARIIDGHVIRYH